MQNINDSDSQPRRLVRNAIECAHCGYLLESRHRHEFRSHVCAAAGTISTRYNHDTKEYEPYFPEIFVDGGLDYQRTGGDRKDFIDRSEWT